jgi:hypothetical protein
MKIRIVEQTILFIWLELQISLKQNNISEISAVDST